MVKKITDVEYEALNKSGNIIVDCSATWCGPCKMLAPVLEELSEEYGDRAQFYNIDVDESPTVARTFSISRVPALKFIKNGEIVDTHIGFAPADEIADWIEKNL